MKRELENWISGFLEYTEGLPSPPIFRTWAAIATIAGSLQRKVWTNIQGRNLYPNQYIFLIGPPASGKSTACDLARTFLCGVSSVHLTPSRITEAALYVDLSEAECTYTNPELNEVIHHHSLTAYISEIAVFLRRGDSQFLDSLTHLYDCPELFSNKTKHSGSETIQNVCFNLIACGTQGTLSEIITENNLEQGFPSRVMMIYSAQPMEVDLFQNGSSINTAYKKELRSKLLHDIEMIADMKGEFIWSDDAAQAFIAWTKEGMRPFPLDSKFQHYAQRRIAHLTKLVMACSAARSSSLEITLDDYAVAKSLMLEAERMMPEATYNIGSNKLYGHMRAIVSFVVGTHARTKKPVPEYTIRQRLNREVPLNMLDYILDELVADKSLLARGNKEAHERVFLPGPSSHVHKAKVPTQYVPKNQQP